MKALVIAAALAAFTSIAPAGAARDMRPLDTVDQATASVIADAGTLGPASLTALNGSHAPWRLQGQSSASDFDTPGATPVDAGMLLVAIGFAALALARPVSRALRRQEQHRRATALASTLGQAPKA